MLQAIFHRAWLNFRFPAVAQPIAPLSSAEVAERKARLVQMEREYTAPFETTWARRVRDESKAAKQIEAELLREQAPTGDREPPKYLT